MEAKKSKVLQKYYVIKIGDTEIKMKQSYGATNLVRLLMDEGYNISVEAKEHMLEMTAQEITLAKVHNMDICVLNDQRYNEPCDRY